MHVVRAIRLLEPFEDPRALAETCIHERQRDRGYIALPRSLFQGLQDFACFSGTPQRRKEMPFDGERHVIAAREAPCSCEGLQSSFVPPELLIGLSLLGVPDPELRVDHCSPPRMFKGR